MMHTFKNMKFRPLLFLLILIYTVQAGDKKILTIEESVRLALENNPEMHVAEKEYKKAEAAVGEAYSAVLPSLDATVNFQHAWAIQKSTIPNFIKPMLEPIGPAIGGLDDMPDYVNISFGRENTLTYGATVTQPLFLGGSGISGIRMSRAAKQASGHNLDLVQQQVVYNIAEGFYRAVLAAKLIDVQEEALTQAEANRDAVAKKYEVGTASGFDKMRAEVEVANLKPALITARNNFHSALTRLKTILGIDRNMVIDISGDLMYVSDDIMEEALPALQSEAIQNRPEIRSLNEQEEMMQQGINMARSAFMPKLFFSTEYSFLAMRDNLNFSQDDFSKGFTSAVSLQIPLFKGFKSIKSYQKARLDYHITRDMKEQITNQIYAEVEIAHNAFNEAKEKFFASEETVALARESLRLASLMYEEGANTQLDVLGARLSVTQARMNYYRSLFDYQMARYRLRMVTGRLTGIL